MRHSGIGRFSRTGRIISAAVVAAFLCLSFCFSPALADEPVFKSFNAAMSYVQENRPSELDVGRVRWVPSDLKRLKDEMGDGAVLHFTSVWGDVTLCDGDTEVNLNPASGINADTVEAIAVLCPQVKKITLTKHLNLKNEQMAELIEKYPEIEFVWMVRLGRYHRIASDATAYSTFHEPSETERMISEDLEALRYVRGLKALDLGHNSLTDLDFLKYCPDLELLILGENQGINDITPIGNLSHLQYLELFTTGTEDISPLANCRELIDLNLCYEKKVTDLSVLDGLDKLERFWGNHMDGLSEEEKARFAAAHPGCECVFNGQHATSEGWREHERYDHYRWCLRNSKWIPFGEPLPGK